MRDRTPIRELSKIFAKPTQFQIISSKCRTSLSAPCVRIRRCKEEVEIWIEQEREEAETESYLLTLPMTIEGIERARVTAMRINSLSVELLTSYEVETVQFISNNNPSQMTLADLSIQRVPRNLPTLKASVEEGVISKEEALEALNRLESTLHREGIYFKGSLALSPENVLLGEDRLLYPIRYSQLRVGGCAAESSAVEHLRRWIQESAKSIEAESGTGFKLGEYARRHSELFEGHLFAGHLNEERAIIEELSGWGFVDRDNRVVVEPIYERVYPFREGRAMVLSSKGWGLIDLNGVEIIPSIYESIAYNVSSGLSCVRSQSRWGYFSYLGEQLTPFEHLHPNEDITSQELLALMSERRG